MDKLKLVEIPLIKCDEELDKSETTIYNYRQAIGGLLYLSNKNRPI